MKTILFLTLLILTQVYAESAYCSTSKVSVPYVESFETDFGSWINVATDDFDWARISGATSTDATGPASAQDGSVYIYLESSYPNYPSKTANLTAYVDMTSLTSASLSFWYHMYGDSMGSLHIDISTDGGDTYTDDIVASITDNQNSWQQKTVNLSAYVGNSCVAIRLRGITGINFHSDMAIDNVKITPIPQELDTLKGSWTVIVASGDTDPRDAYANPAIHLLLKNFTTPSENEQVLEGDVIGFVSNTKVADVTCKNDVDFLYERSDYYCYYDYGGLTHYLFVNDIDTTENYLLGEYIAVDPNVADTQYQVQQAYNNRESYIGIAVPKKGNTVVIPMF